jgi:cytochrome c556
MKRSLLTCIAVVAANGLSGPAVAQQPSAPSAADGPGWTGLTNPKDVIAAREALMVAIERLMEPIDSIEVEPPKDPTKVTAAAARISELLLALPHLFPPTTNLYDPKSDMPETLALPAIWESFPNFYQLAAAASAAAKKLSSTSGTEQLDAAGEALRGTCDACHALYLRPYVPSKVNQDDLNFDFDSALPKKK